MELTFRCVKILAILLERPGLPVTVRKLSQQLGVAERTIRYDLGCIDEWLRKHKFPRLIRRPGIGLQMPATISEAERISCELGKVFPQYHALSAEERLKVLLLRLLTTEDNKPVSLKQLAEDLGMSRSTLSKDLKQVGNWLADRKLQLIGKPNYGMVLRGTEHDKRRASAEVIRHSIRKSRLLYGPGTPEGPAGAGDARISRQVEKVLEVINIEQLQRFLREMERSLGIRWTDEGITGFLTHLATVLWRLQAGQAINLDSALLVVLEQTKEFRAVEGLCVKLTPGVVTTFPPQEIAYLAMHLLGSKVYEAEKADEASLLLLGDIDLARVIAATIDQVEGVLGKQIIQKEQLTRGLIVHLRPALYRIKFGMRIQNPLLPEVREQYPELFATVKQAVEIIENAYHVQISEDETAYLTMHFGAALEQAARESANRIRLLVVCNSGLGTAKLLAARIRTEFPGVEVTGTVSTQSLLDAPDMDADMIVSTIPLYGVTRSHLVINPLLLPEDVDKLRHFLAVESLPLMENMRVSAVTRRVLDIVSRHAVVNDRDQLLTELAYYFSEYDGKAGRAIVRKNDGPELFELLNHKTVKTGLKAADWREAVRLAGKMLCDTGCAGEEYVPAMISSIEQHGPYVVVAPGVALPHGKPGDGVKGVGMSLVTLREPVRFGHRENDPVKLIIAFAAVDEVLHVKALTNLVKLIAKPENVAALSRLTEIYEVLDLIRLAN